MSQEINELLKDSREKSWRQLEAIRALGEYTDPQVISTLIELLDVELDATGFSSEDENWKRIKESHDVRWEATKSLVRIGEPSVEPLLYTFKKIDQVENIIVDRSVMWALGEIGDERALEPLNRIATTLHGPKDIQTYAMNAMVKIGESSISYFIDALKPIEDTRKFRYVLAASALTALGKSSVEALTQALDPENVEYCRYIVDILGEIGDLRAVDAFIKLMSLPKGEKEYSNDQYPLEVYYAIREALKKMGEPATDSLIHALNNKNEKVRLGAVRALGLLGKPKSVQPLIKATGDDDTNVSYAALGSLRRTIGELEKLSGNKCVVNMELITARGLVPEPPSPPRY